jgi:ribosomal protein L37AE/L43A
MPSREEEYSAEKQEPRGEPLCPFCGSKKVYYNKHFKTWRCGACEKSFPSPSYGGKGRPSWFQRHFGRK